MGSRVRLTARRRRVGADRCLSERGGPLLAQQAVLPGLLSDARGVHGGRTAGRGRRSRHVHADLPAAVLRRSAERPVPGRAAGHGGHGVLR